MNFLYLRPHRQNHDGQWSHFCVNRIGPRQFSGQWLCRQWPMLVPHWRHQHVRTTESMYEDMGTPSFCVYVSVWWRVFGGGGGRGITGLLHNVKIPRDRPRIRDMDWLILIPSAMCMYIYIYRIHIYIYMYICIRFAYRSPSSLVLWKDITHNRGKRILICN